MAAQLAGRGVNLPCMKSDQELRFKPGSDRGLLTKVRIMKDELEILSGGERVKS